MKTQLSWLKVLPVVAVVVLFAVTMASAAAVPGASTGHPSSSTATFALSHQIPVPNGPQALASGNKACPITTQCTYVADKIGGVQVFSGNNLIASVSVVLTPSDPSTCPEFAYAWFGSILVSDACGDNGAGELRVLNPATNVWGTPITVAGGGPLAMVGDTSNGDLYVTNFGYGTVTVLSSATTVAGTVATCGSYPGMLDYDSASKIVFVGNEGFISAACIDMIKGTTAGSPIVSAGTYTLTVSDAISGVTVNQHTGNVYITDPNYNAYAGGVFEYGKRGAYKATIAPPSISDGLSGSTYDASSQSVYVVSDAHYTLGFYNATGFVFNISGSNAVSGAHFVGLGPNADCYNPASLSVYVPNTSNVLGSGVTVFKGATIHNISIYGPVEGYGCGAN